jgi:thiamine pyrophosphate-dependent acetolactate synthase large subunit-like protein
MNGADTIARAIRVHTRVAFGLPGAHNLALWPACERAGVRIVGMRHEQGCAYAADGWSRVTGDVGVALVTTGPGAANTVGALGEAWASRSPVAVIATDIASSLRRPGVYRGVLHESTDQAALFAPITKARTTLDGVHGIFAALHTARAVPTRPVYIGVPSDRLGAPAAPTTADVGPENPVDVDVQPVLAALARSERPLLWVGGGAKEHGGAIDALARKLGAPVVTTYQARGVLPPDHPLLVPAPPHEPEVTDLITRSDLVVVIGSDLDQMNTMQWRLPLPRSRIAINIDRADATKNYDMDDVLVADAGASARIADELAPRAPWAGNMRALGDAVRARLAPDALAFLELTETTIPDDTAVFADMCVAGYWLAGHLRVAAPRGLHYPMGWGTLGFALPAAIGASVARPTVAVVGDGGALFAIGELSALAALGTPCTVVVVDDGGYGMLKHGPHATTANDLPPVDFVMTARSFGIEAMAVDGLGTDYAKALAEATASAEPRLIHARAALPPPATTTPYWPLQG